MESKNQDGNVVGRALQKGKLTKRSSGLVAKSVTTSADAVRNRTTRQTREFRASAGPCSGYRSRSWGAIKNIDNDRGGVFVRKDIPDPVARENHAARRVRHSVHVYVWNVAHRQCCTVHKDIRLELEVAERTRNSEHTTDTVVLHEAACSLYAVLLVQKVRTVVIRERRDTRRRPCSPLHEHCTRISEICDIKVSIDEQPSDSGRASRTSAEDVIDLPIELHEAIDKSPRRRRNNLRMRRNELVDLSGSLLGDMGTAVSIENTDEGDARACVRRDSESKVRAM